MSASASAHILYGLPVRICDLLAAGEAYKFVGPALYALKLISLRRGRASLVVELEGGAVQRIPVEVWKMIGEILIPLGIKQGRSIIQEESHCEECEKTFLGRHEDVRAAFPTGMTIKIRAGQSLLNSMAETVRRRRTARQAKHVWNHDWADYRNWPKCRCQANADVELNNYWSDKLGRLTVSPRCHGRFPLPPPGADRFCASPGPRTRGCQISPPHTYESRPSPTTR